MRECFKNDDRSQWEKPKFDPPPHLNPLTDRHQNLPAQQVADSAICSFCWVLQIIYIQDARTDCGAKYVKRRGSSQGCAFWGSQSQKLSFTPFFAPKTAILGPFFYGI